LAGSVGVYQEYQQGYSAYNGTNGNCGVASGAPKAQIGGFVKLEENNYTALMNAIATVGPIAVSVDANWGSYAGGVFAGCDPTKNVDIDHAVVLVGYGVDNGQDYWLVRNSWSPSWGEGGYIRVARSSNDDNNCAMDSTPSDGTACAGDTTPVKVCGTCGILYDSSYPTDAALF
jgi:cathepsin L